MMIRASAFSLASRKVSIKNDRKTVTLLTRANTRRNNDASILRTLGYDPSMNSKALIFTSNRTQAPVLKRIKVHSMNNCFDVGYEEDGPQDGRVIVAMHGAPGESRDFAALFEPLALAGCRVIAINFPGYGITTAEKEFATGANENARLTLDFCKALGIHEVEAWMGHSWGTHVAYQLAAETDVARTVIALSSLGYIHQKTAKFFPLIKLWNYMCHVPVVRPLFRWPMLYLFRGRGFRVEDSGPLVTALGNISKSGYERMKGYGHRIKEKNLPLLIVSTVSDPIVQPEVPLKMSQACGFTDDLMVKFDEDKQITSGPEDVGPRRFLLFARGGHYAHRAHTDIVVKYILGVLNSSRIEKQ